MRPLTALFILAACQCLHAHQDPRTPRQLFKETFHALLGRQSKPVRRILSCAETLGLSKCISALGVWRAERALKAFATNLTTRFNLIKDVESFPWEKYNNTTDEKLHLQLLDRTQALLQYRSLTFDMLPGYIGRLNSNGNGSLTIDVHKTEKVEGRTSMKKIQKEFYKFAPILLAPGMFISALVPFVLPSLKMMVLMVGFMNQMALVGAIFTILRNNAFNDKYENKVVYVNSGYENEKIKFSASNNEEHFHTNHLGILYEDPKAPLPKPIVDPPFEDNFGNLEELPALAVSPQWIKEYTDGKMIAMLNENHPNENVYYNGRIPIDRSKVSNQ